MHRRLSNKELTRQKVDIIRNNLKVPGFLSAKIFKNNDPYMEKLMSA